jgi:hypothetical protein
MSRAPRGRSGKGSGSESITVAKIALIGTVLAALITAAATVIPALLKDGQSPTVSGDGGGIPPSVEGAQVEFFSPREGDSISPGDSVMVSGTVTGLGQRQLWILSWHEDGKSFFMVPGAAGVSAVSTKDGPWSVTDEGVGNPSDQGKTIVYTAVLAGAKCAQALSVMHNSDSFHVPPPGCIILPDRRDVRVK